MKLELKVVVDAQNQTVQVVAPCPAYFEHSLSVGDLLSSHTPIGRLDILGRKQPVFLPAGIAGRVASLAHESSLRIAVDARTVLFSLDTRMIEGAIASVSADSASTTGNLFRSPMSGRLYHKAAPDKAAFIHVGSVLRRGEPVALLEVMKTFNRVVFEGTVPDRVRVLELLTTDGADVDRNAPLFRYEAVEG